MNGITEKQIEALHNALDKLIDVIVERVSERVLPEIDKKEPRYYSRDETARILHVTLPTLGRLTREGLIAGTKIGRRILYEAEAIDAAVKENRIFKYKH